MGTAYTPGLTISRSLIVRRERRLPLAGEILVSVGDEVEAATSVARALLPGDLVTVRAGDELGIEPSELPDALKVAAGAEVKEGDVLAEVKGLFGLFTSRATAPASGTVEFASAATGHIGIRRAPVPVEVTAFVRGRVAEVRPPDSVTVATRAALVQGVFGVGGETTGVVTCPVESPQSVLSAAGLAGGLSGGLAGKLPEDLSGMIVVGGAWAEPEAWRLLAERKAAGLVVGSLRDSDLRAYLGYDLGLAITGHEDVPFPVVVTDGFGRLPMSEAAFGLLKSIEGREASMTGQTQIRAGAVRPEVVSPLEQKSGACGTWGAGPTAATSAASAGELAVGSRVRLIRHPHFGLVGKVVALPEEPTEIATGARVRVLVAQIEGEVEGEGRLVVPRSNVELF